MTQARRTVIETMKVVPPSDAPPHGGTTDLSLTLRRVVRPYPAKLGTYRVKEGA